ncbi:MAG: ankyrin repeat domain-containing protein [Prevotellaceae bacterium]|jgi:ankyrin repeat protein|nr:ankyrin repeat domain-containing protein [Prevotellaceae bacterium]
MKTNLIINVFAVLLALFLFVSIGFGNNNVLGLEITQMNLEEFIKKAENGDVQAQIDVGKFYAQENNYDESVKWYRKAAEKGNADARLLLGTCYLIGLGVPKDEVEANKWLQDPQHKKNAQNKNSTPANESEIVIAIKNENLKTVKRLIKENPASLDQYDGKGLTPIHYAAAFNSKIDIVKFLIDSGVNVERKSQQDYTPLFAAAAINPDSTVTKYLVERGADVNRRIVNGMTVLHVTCMSPRASAETIKFLIQKKANVNAKDKNGLTPLHYAAISDVGIDVIKCLLESGADPKIKSNSNRQELEALANRQIQRTSIANALRATAPVKTEYTTDFEIKDGEEIIVERKIQHFDENPIDPNYVSSIYRQTLENSRDGFLPWQVAKTYEKQLLLKERLPEFQYLPYDNNETIIIKAVKKGDLKKVKNLIQAEPNLINTCENYNQSLLHIATRSPNIEILKLLISKNADVNIKDNENWTPLVIAALNNNKEAIIYLGVNGAELPSQKDAILPSHYEKHLREMTLAGANTYSYEQKLKNERIELLTSAIKNITESVKDTFENKKKKREDYILKKE